MCVNEKRLNGAAGKIKNNFKIRRRSEMFFQVTILFCFVNFGLCSESNDVLTLQDGSEVSDDDIASDRRRPSNTQEKDILLLDALGRRKGTYHSSYSTSQEDDSIMDLLGKSKYLLSVEQFFLPIFFSPLI